MKKIILLGIIAHFAVAVHAQTDSLVKKRTSASPVRVSTIPKPTTATLGTTEKNIPVPQLPDLKIIALDVKFYNSSSVDLNARKITVSYTIKNEGTVEVKLFDVKMQGIILADPNHTNGPGGGFMPASNKLTDVLKPGGTFNGRLEINAASLDLKYTKFYRLSADCTNDIKETIETNNAALAVVLVQ